MPTEEPENSQRPVPTAPSGESNIPGDDTDTVSGELKNGSKITDKKTKAVYQVTGTGKYRTVKYLKTTKKKTVSVTVPASVKLKGKWYKITAIGAKAFYKCKSLQYILVKTKKLKAGNIGKKAFANGYPNPRIKTDKKLRKKYAGIFISKGISKRTAFIAWY